MGRSIFFLMTQFFRVRRTQGTFSQETREWPAALHDYIEVYSWWLIGNYSTVRFVRSSVLLSLSGLSRRVRTGR